MKAYDLVQLDIKNGEVQKEGSVISLKPKLLNPKWVKQWNADNKVNARLYRENKAATKKFEDSKLKADKG